MKKLTKISMLLLILSFICMITNVSAATYKYLVLNLPSSKGTKSIGTLSKNLFGAEVLYIEGTLYNRDIDFKLNSSNGYDGTTGWIKNIAVGDNPVAKYLGVNQNIPNYSVYTWEGTKKMYLRTNISWLSETNFAGSWWTEYQTYENYN